MKDNYYFDNAATSWPKPESVYAYMDEFARTAAVNPGRAGHARAIEAELMVQQTRRMLAGFFNFSGGSERVVFTLNATDSLNQLLSGLLRTGDHVITSVLEHNALARPLNHQQHDHAVTVSQVPVCTALPGHMNTLAPWSQTVPCVFRLVILPRMMMCIT